MKNVSLTLRQRKSLILFLILTIILMIIPPIILNVFKGSFGGSCSYRSFGYPSYSRCNRIFGDTSYFAPILTVDDTVDKQLGTLALNYSLRNSTLYQGLLGRLPQLKVYTYASSYCTVPSPIQPYVDYASPYTESFSSPSAMLSRARYLSQESMCYDWERSSSIHLKSLDADYGATTPIKMDVDFWEPNYRPSDTCGPLALKTLLLGRIMNYTYDNTNRAMSQYYSQIWYAPMPTVNIFDGTDPNARADAPKNGFGLTFYWIFSMLVLSFLTPMFTQRPVIERADGLVDLSIMMGLSRIAHWLGHLTLDFIIYIFFYILILIVAAASAGYAILAMVQPWVIFACLFYGITCIFTAYLISFIFRSPRAALVMSYIFALVQFAIAAVFNMILTDTTSNLPGLLMAWPSFNFFRVTYVGLLAASYPTHHAEYTPVLRNAFIALVGETIILVAIVFALDRWLPTKLGHRGSTLNLITDGLLDLFRKLKHKCNGRKSLKADQYDDDSDEAADSLLFDSEEVKLGGNIKKDPRVQEERRRVVSGNTEGAVMVIREVRKIYAEGAKRFTALGGISFALQPGDCFGLLGPNGAGKSTLVAIMSGILAATSGSVTVAKSSERCAIGLCPQDDLYYADLTVEEHLLYYSRIKGKGRGEDLLAVASILADVSMQNERRLRASSLSGGQKRRLSVASALCGDPMVVFLDEPSSSLDPGSRIGLWEIIQSVSQSRCTLLTTHSMDEAEVLCNRIGIIKDGHMVCLGSSSQLKNLYGEGYKLELTLTPGIDIDDQIMPALQAKVAPEAVVVSQKYGHVTVQLGSEATLSQVTQLLETQKKALGIHRWSLSRNGLDEVFLSIVEDRGAMPSLGSLNDGSKVNGADIMEV